MNEKKEIKFIDLFGGIGGFRLGLEQTNYYKSTTEKWKSNERGNRHVSEQRNKFHDRSTATFSCVWYCDIDKYATQTYNKNFQENYEPTDITTVNPKNIPNHDLLCAGFPC